MALRGIGIRHAGFDHLLIACMVAREALELPAAQMVHAAVAGVAGEHTVAAHLRDCRRGAARLPRTLLQRTDGVVRLLIKRRGLERAVAALVLRERRGADHRAFLAVGFAAHAVEHAEQQLRALRRADELLLRRLRRELERAVAVIVVLIGLSHSADIRLCIALQFHVSKITDLFPVCQAADRRVNRIFSTIEHFFSK